MKKRKTHRTLLRSSRAKIAILAFGTFMVLGASVAMAMDDSHTSGQQPTTATVTHAKASSQSVKQSAGAAPTKKPAAPPLVAKPPTPAPAPTPVATPKPATNVAASPAAVASTSTKPGSGISGLSSSAGSPAPAEATPPSSPSTTPSPTPCTNKPGQYGSSNWAGYFKTGCTFTAIAGKWTVPTATTTSTTDTTVDATWIGIGGVTSDDLIQVGTEDTVSTDGTINAAVFYELLPDAPHYPTTITVSAGDQMSASIAETSTNSWLITISNLTTAKTFSKTVAYTATHSSAEWIEEDPSYSDGSLVPFDNFGTVRFTEANATGNGTVGTLADASSVKITDGQHRTLAAPSSVSGANNDSFSVSRQTP